MPIVRASFIIGAHTPGGALDAALTDHLAEFDELLLSEQKKVAAKPPRVSSGSGYGDEGQGKGEQADGAEGEGGRGGAQGEGEGKDHADPAPHLDRIHVLGVQILSVVEDLAVHRHAGDEVVHSIKSPEQRALPAS